MVILWLDLEGIEGVVAVMEVAAGVGDVGSSGEAEGADREVAEGCQGSRRGAGAQLRSILVPCAVAHPVDRSSHCSFTVGDGLEQAVLWGW